MFTHPMKAGTFTKSSGFGSWIWIDSQEACGKDIIYGHVHHPGILVKAGDRVRADQQMISTQCNP